MDLSYFLHVLRRRLWILVLVPVLAAAAVTGLVLTQKPKFSATAVVAAPALVGGSTQNQYTGSAGAKDYLANFTAAASSPLVTSQVATQTGTSKGAVASCLSVAPIGASTLLDVTCTTTKKSVAGPIAQADASDTLKFLFSTQANLAQGTVQQAQTNLQSANQALLQFENTNGVLLDQTYANQETLVNQLQQEQDNEIANGHATSAASVTGQISAARARLAQLVPLVAKYDQLTAARSDAQSRYDNAVANSRAATVQLGAADPTKAVSVGDTTKASRVSTIVTYAAPAFGAGLFLAIVAVIVLELLARRRSAGSGTGSGSSGTGSGTGSTTVAPAERPRQPVHQQASA